MAMAPTMRVICKMYGGVVASGYYFDVSVDAMVDSLRELISARRGIPPTRVILSYTGQQLEDGRSLADYGISADSTIELADAASIRVTLLEFGGEQRSHTVNVSPQMELGELRYLAGQVVGVHGIGLLALALVVGATRCTDMEGTLADHGIVDGSAVTIVEVSSFEQ